MDEKNRNTAQAVTFHIEREHRLSPSTKPAHIIKYYGPAGPMYLVKDDNTVVATSRVIGLGTAPVIITDTKPPQDLVTQDPTQAVLWEAQIKTGSIKGSLTGELNEKGQRTYTLHKEQALGSWLVSSQLRTYALSKVYELLNPKSLPAELLGSQAATEHNVVLASSSVVEDLSRKITQPQKKDGDSQQTPAQQQTQPEKGQPAQPARPTPQAAGEPDEEELTEEGGSTTAEPQEVKIPPEESGNKDELLHPRRDEPSKNQRPQQKSTASTTTDISSQETVSTTGEEQRAQQPEELPQSPAQEVVTQAFSQEETRELVQDTQEKAVAAEQIHTPIILLQDAVKQGVLEEEHVVVSQPEQPTTPLQPEEAPPQPVAPSPVPQPKTHPLAEGMEKDVWYQQIRESLKQQWLTTHNQQDFSSPEGQSFIYGRPQKGEPLISPLEQETRKIFERDFPDVAQEYKRLEHKRVYENPYEDPVVQELFVKIRDEVNREYEFQRSHKLAPVWDKLYRLVSFLHWDKFIAEYKEKTTAYKEKVPQVKQAVVRREEKEKKTKQASITPPGEISLEETAPEHTDPTAPEKIHPLHINTPHEVHQQVRRRAKTTQQIRKKRNGLFSRFRKKKGPLRARRGFTRALARSKFLKSLLSRLSVSALISPVGIALIVGLSILGLTIALMIIDDSGSFGLGDEEETSETGLGPIPGLTIDKSGDTQIDNGGQINYAITVTYDPSVSDVPADSITIYDQIPPNTEFVSAGPEGTYVYSHTTRTISWPLSNFEPVESAYSLNLAVTLLATQDDSIVRNKAYAYSTYSPSGDISACRFYRGPQGSAPYRSPILIGLFNEASQASGVPAVVIAAVGQVESLATQFTDEDIQNLQCEQNSFGATGLMQIVAPGFNGHPAEGYNTAAAFFGREPNLCDVRENVITGGFVIASKAGGGWDHSRTNDRNYLNSMASGYYGCNPPFYSEFGNCTPNGPYNYTDDLYNSVSQCVETAPPSDGGSPPGPAPADPRQAMINEFGITMDGFDQQHLEWAYIKLKDVSRTKFIDLVRGTFIQARTDNNPWSQWNECPNGDSNPDILLIQNQPGRDVFEITLIHELAHPIQYCKGPEAALYDRHQQAYNKEGGITYYAQHGGEYDQYGNLLPGTDPACPDEITRHKEDYADMITYYLNPTYSTKDVCGKGRASNPYQPYEPVPSNPNEYVRLGFPDHARVVRDLLGPYH